MKQLVESILDKDFDINDPIINPKLWSNFKNPMAFQHIVFGAMNTNRVIISGEFMDRFDKFLDGFKSEIESLGIDPDTIFNSNALSGGLYNILVSIPDKKQAKNLQKDVDIQTESLKYCIEIDDFMYGLIKNDWKKMRCEAYPMHSGLGDSFNGILLSIYGSRENNKELEDLIASNSYTTKSFKVEPGFAGRQTNIEFIKK